MADEKNDKKAKAEAEKPAKTSTRKTAKKESKSAKAESSSSKKEPKAKKAPAKKATAKKDSKAPKETKAKGAKDAKAEDKGKGKKADAKAESKKAAKKEPAKRAKAKAPSAPPVVRAKARYVRVAPRKARLVADQVRGLHIEQALALLQFSPRGAAQDIQKLIESAAANAENNHDLVGDEMRISSITVDEGPTLRRFRPRALGRATPINKRTSHIAVALTPAEDE
jgi:ribosomal protein L22